MLTESNLIPPELDAYIREQMARWTVPGVVVGALRDSQRETRAYGVASLETGYPVRPDTLFPIGSISKMYTAALAMTLIDEGKLDLDAPVITYLPKLTLADESARGAITMRHLLTHQSGLFGDYLEDFGMGDDALARCVASFGALRQLHAPGELWAYCNSGFILAGRVIEVVTGQSFEAAMRERVFEPRALGHSFYFAQDAIVYPTAIGHSLKTPGGDEHEVRRKYMLSRTVAPAGGIISDAGDLLTFAALMMGDGMWNGRRVLSRAALEEMLTPQTRAAHYAEAGFEEWCGLGWAIRFMDGVTVVEHGGSLTGFQTRVTLVPARQFAVAILTNSGRGAVLADGVADWALEHYQGLVRRRPEQVSLPDEALARFAGHYRAPDEDVALAVADGGLRRLITVNDAGGGEQTYPANLLRPISEREFVVVTPDEHEGWQIDFIEGVDGAIRFLRMDGRLYERVMGSTAG